MEKKKPRSRQDEIELAKSIFDEIVAETESEDWNKPINEAAQKGGKVRAAKLAPEQRSEIARKAAEKKWIKYYKEKEQSG